MHKEGCWEFYKLIIDLNRSIHDKHDHCRVDMVIFLFILYYTLIIMSMSGFAVREGNISNGDKSL